MLMLRKILNNKSVHYFNNYLYFFKLMVSSTSIFYIITVLLFIRAVNT